MKGFNALLLGIFATLAFSWMGLAFIPNLQIGHLEPQTDEEGKDAYPAPKSGMAERGRRVYVANGCFYCHSQQVRADYAGSDIDRKWGERRSAPRDYIFDRPVELGRMRMGPDLANIGHRAPPEDQNAPAGSSPPAAAGASPASASPAPGASNPPPNPAANPSGGAATATPAGQPTAPLSPGGPAANAVPKGQPAATTAPNPPASPPPPSTSPAPNVAGAPKASPAPSPPGPTGSPSNTAAANTAVAGSSPAGQQAPSAPGAATSLEVSSSASPAPYSAAWHHVHLYSPRSINLDSSMPAYKFLYIKRPIGGQRSAEALKLTGEEAPGDGWEVIPSFEANCLVAYLISLDQSHPLKEVKAAATPASSPSPAKSP